MYRRNRHSKGHAGWSNEAGGYAPARLAGLMARNANKSVSEPNKNNMIYRADFAPEFTSPALKTTVPREAASAATSREASRPRTGIARVRTRKMTARTALMIRVRFIG